MIVFAFVMRLPASVARDFQVFVEEGLDGRTSRNLRACTGHKKSCDWKQENRPNDASRPGGALIVEGFRQADRAITHRHI